MSSPKPRILIVEDDESLARSWSIGFRHGGYEVHTNPDGAGFADLLRCFRPDLVILDVGLPGEVDGFALAAVLRSELACPMVFLTALDGLAERLRGFDLGADDYIVKPVALAELLARARVVLRRAGRETSPVREVRDLVIDERTGTVLRAGRTIELTATERNLLLALASEPGRVLSKLQLLSLVWGFDEYDPNLVEVYISSLRRKLGPDGTSLIRTERGRGYVLAP